MASTPGLLAMVLIVWFWEQCMYISIYINNASAGATMHVHLFNESQKLWYYMHTTLLFFCTKFERDQRLVNLLLLFFFARVNELGSLGE